jgi:hypothetical protein
MSTHFGNRDGTLRILHTTKDKNMTFESAGGFKQMFINKDRLGKAGEAVEHLMTQAGYPKEVIEQFQLYRNTQGRRGLETRKVMEFVNAGLVAQGKNLEDALEKFGCKVPSSPPSNLFGWELSDNFNMQHRGRDATYLTYPKNLSTELKLNSNESPPQAPIVDSQSSDSNIAGDGLGQETNKLAHEGDLIPNRVKDMIPHVIKPTAFVVSEPDPQSKYGGILNVVPAGPCLKNWASEKLASSSSMDIAGMVMPRAPGKALMTTLKPKELQPGQLARLAQTGLETIRTAAEQGFDLGDLNPNKIVTDGKEFKFVDFRDLNGFTRPERHYSLPSQTESKQDGFQRDLYAFGKTLATLALHSEGATDSARSIEQIPNGPLWVRQREYLKDPANTLEKSPLMEAMKTFRARLPEGEAPAGSALDFGLKCMEAAFTHVPTGATRFDPSSASANHPLVKLAQHPVITGQFMPN